MKNVFLLLLTWTGSLFAVNDKFIPPASCRQKINIDFDWKYINRDFPHEEETHQVNQLPWQTVNLPHDASIAGVFAPDNNTTQGFLPMEIGWYNKGLFFPESCQDKKIFILFDGVYRASDVWMNYAFLGHHESGYTSFYYDLTDYVRFGDRTPNGLRVRVDGRRHEQDMYEGTGIYRHVWLLITDKFHVDYNGTFVSTPRISETAAVVRVRTRVTNEHPATKRGRLQTVIVDADGVAVREMTTRHEIPAGGEFEFIQEGALQRPHLWDTEDPNLYRVYSILYDGETVVDTYETTFGIRSFYFSADQGFFLNGRSVKLKGFNAHHDYAGLGSALPDRMHWNAMMAMKKAGFNLYRSSHNPATPERLDICDRIGMLVWDEIERKLESPEVELPLMRDTIMRDRNHPSIILWSLENESPLESTRYGTNIIRQATALAHQLDPTRLTTLAASMPVNKNGYGEALDVVSYNYDWRRLDQDHLDFPLWKIGLVSEYSATRARRGVYGFERFARAEEDSYFDLYSGMVSNMYELCRTVEESWQRIKARPYVSGGCLWSGLDYWGEGNAWPLVSRGDGALDMCLIPKDVYYYFVSQYTEKPMLHVFPHWNWPGQEGKQIEVWCYSNCDSVELFLNNNSLGTHKRSFNPAQLSPLGSKNPKPAENAAEHLSWQVPYQPGTLYAKGIRAGITVCRQEIRTAGAPARIQLSHVMAGLIDEKSILPLIADGRDIALIQAAILDQHGNPVPDAGNLVQFMVEGWEKIVGVGNGDIASHELNQVSFRKAYNGFCIAILQSTAYPDTFDIIATSPGLASARLKIISVMPEPVGIMMSAKSIRPTETGEILATAVVVDIYGTTIPTATKTLTFLLQGPAVFSSGAKSATATIANGKAEMIIKCLGTGGKVRITAVTADLFPAAMEIIPGL